LCRGLGTSGSKNRIEGVYPPDARGDGIDHHIILQIHMTEKGSSQQRG
jgi:hypothetical protein